MTKRTRKRKFAPYSFCVAIPDHLYPFSAMVEGERVRWKRSYDHALASARRRLGPGSYGAKLIAYREAFHFLGTILFISVATLVSHRLFGSDVALPMLFVTAILALTYQEFYLQPRRYGQHLVKGLLDWMTWVVPMAAFYFLLR